MKPSLLAVLCLISICSTAVIDRPRPGREITQNFDNENYQLPQRRSITSQRKFRFFPPRAGRDMLTSSSVRSRDSEGLPRELCARDANKRCAQLWDEAGRIMGELIQEDTRMMEEWEGITTYYGSHNLEKILELFTLSGRFRGIASDRNYVLDMGYSLSRYKIQFSQWVSKIIFIYSTFMYMNVEMTSKILI